ncbi:MAG: FprA family A-type flavoprotein [Candidatus Eisenbacteria bacterium]|nr:FprA family A-type flavoprotein [Candidatus Eisenbacteria bacterium]
MTRETQPFNALKISDRIYWVGAIDWALRDFHGYSTNRGSTYNSYLILADKITLIDTVKKPFKDEFLSRIKSVVDPGDIDYVISGHAEMDHSGCLPEIIEIAKPEKVFASTKGVKALGEHFHTAYEITPVKDGETMSLGNMTLRFIETPMLHWPESMFTYLADEQVLFSQDAFGMHLASSEMFDDLIAEDVLRYEASKYYANILLLYSPLVTKLLENVKGLGLPIRTIAAAHGPVWRKDLKRILDWYSKWAAQSFTNKAVIVYDTMWGSTALMARAIGDGLASEGVSVKTLPLGASDRSEVALELLDAGAFLVGTSTLNNQMLPRIADVLTYLKGLRPQNLIGVAFGSFGWGGEAVKQVSDILKEMKVEVIGEGIKARFVPDNEALMKCHEFGAQMARELEARCNIKT